MIIDGKEYDFTETYAPANELEFKRYAKRFAKLALYEVLSAVYGKKMPWGSLTGIRPTKLAYAEREAGRDFRALFEKFGVSEENISIVEDILCEQEGIYQKREGDADLYVGIQMCIRDRHNPISVIVPCHRVLGSDGSLTGYAGGTDKKIRLLQLEGVRI